MDNKRGQASMMTIPFMIVLGVVGVLILFAMLPILTEGNNTARNQDGLNCKSGSGDVDINGVQMYNSSRSTDNLTCVVQGFTTLFYVLGAIMVITTALMAGNMFGRREDNPVAAYPQY